jgi:hypothetical protein
MDPVSSEIAELTRQRDLLMLTIRIGKASMQWESLPDYLRGIFDHAIASCESSPCPPTKNSGPSPS